MTWSAPAIAARRLEAEVSRESRSRFQCRHLHEARREVRLRTKSRLPAMPTTWIVRTTTRVDVNADATDSALGSAFNHCAPRLVLLVLLVERVARSGLSAQRRDQRVSAQASFLGHSRARSSTRG